MIGKHEYIEYLLSTPFNYTSTNMADHKPNLSHDVVSDFLRREHVKPADLWAIVKDHIDDSPTASIIVDDSVQDKRYSFFIELVKKQYLGNEHGTVKGIGLVNFVHSGGNDGDFWPIDYQVYHPDTDGKTKNDHVEPGRRSGDVYAAYYAQTPQSHRAAGADASCLTPGMLR